MPLVTFGHGTASQQELVDVLVDADVASVVDVRRHPGSRRHPHVARAELERWLPDAGIAYRWEERLGGRRRPDPRSPHTGLVNASFRAYADHMASPEFAAAVDDLLAEATRHRVAVMCSESVWWRCHRRLISDHLVLVRGVAVQHLFHDGRLADHPPLDIARVAGGQVRYDVPAER